MGFSSFCVYLVVLLTLAVMIPQALGPLTSISSICEGGVGERSDFLEVQVNQ